MTYKEEILATLENMLTEDKAGRAPSEQSEVHGTGGSPLLMDEKTWNDTLRHMARD